MKYIVFKLIFIFVASFLIVGCGDNNLNDILYDCDGSGTIKYSNGEYKGECKKDKRDGYGVMRWIYGENNETVYKGYWEDDKRNGYGEIIYHWGSIYKGNWINDSREGNGTYYYSNGTVYKGEWKSDRKNGYGVIEYYDGVKYEGNWINDVIDLDISKYIIELQESDNILTVVMPQKDYDMLDGKKSFTRNEFLEPFIKKVVYQKFEDSFDNINIIFNNKIYSKEYKYSAFYHSILQDVDGIGKVTYDNSFKYGSNHILKSVMYHISIEGFQFSFEHEILHRFANSFIPTTYVWHYSFTTGGILGGFSSETLEQIDSKTFQAHYKDRKTFGIGANPFIGYSFLDLYLMGLASKDEVPEIKIARCDDNKTDCLYWIDENNGKFHADYIETLTINDLIRKHGERIPKYGDAPNKFRGLVILISPTKIDSENIEALDKNIGFVTEHFYDHTLERATVKFDDLSDELKN